MSTSNGSVGASRVNFDDLAGVKSSEKAARAFVAFKAHRVIEQGPRQQNRVAAAALLNRRDRPRFRRGFESVDQTVDQAGVDVRHVAEQHERRGHVGRQRARGRSRSDEARPVAKSGLTDDRRREARERRLDPSLA